MIEVTAKLSRGSVYFAGETIQCTLRFQNVSSSIDSQNLTETIAWASVHIHCFCCINESRVVLPPALLKKKLQKSAGEVIHVTSFVPHRDEQGHCILQTPVKILFCDLKLSPGESKLFHFKERIPVDTPPSYKGPSCKYSYKITVGTQRVGAPIKLLRIPFRVLIVAGLEEYLLHEEEIPGNPFLEHTSSKPDLLEVASAKLSSNISRRSSKTFKLANGRGLMGVFSLMKTSAKLGDDIVGMFSFTEATVPVVQFTVCLQCEEILADECQRSPTQGNSLLSYSKHVEFCLYAEKCNLILPVPLNVTPGFYTDLVCLKWRLHFDFVTAAGPVKGLDLETGQSGDRMWQGPAQLGTETMAWDIPFHILPTMPTQAENIASSQNASLLQF